jgi:hypothetical protein
MKFIYVIFTLLNIFYLTQSMKTSKFLKNLKIKKTNDFPVFYL